MVRQKQQHELQHLTVPPFFRCPISMDVMKSPVSLCTGVTYDRSSIQAWLDTGHKTCPATNIPLPSTDFVPNLTLRRLIHIWSHTPNSTASVSKLQVLESIKLIKNKVTVSVSVCLSQIMEFAKESDENCEFLIRVDGFVQMLIVSLSNTDEIGDMEMIISILEIILLSESSKAGRLQLQNAILKNKVDVILSKFVSVLEKGSLRSRTNSAMILEIISVDSNLKSRIGDNSFLLKELFGLASSGTDQAAIEAGLSCLIAVSSSRTIQKELVQLGIARISREILARPETSALVVEKLLQLLRKVSACAEGRAAIGSDAALVAEVVKRIMKVSKAATEHGVAVVWSVCYLSRDVAAQEAVIKSNGLTKVLLVMQSGCSVSTKQMCVELVKVFRVNSKSCLASYETQTTHIMPY